MKINVENSIYEVKTTSWFNKDLKKVVKQINYFFSSTKLFILGKSY